MPATVIAERISWTRGITILKERVAELRPAVSRVRSLPENRLSPRRACAVGSVAAGCRHPVGSGHSARLPVIVGVSGYSRVVVARMIASRQAPDVLLGHYACLVDLGAIPRKGIYDNEAAIGRKRNYGTVFTSEFLAFKGALGMGAVILEKGPPRKERRGRARHWPSRDELSARTDV